MRPLPEPSVSPKPFEITTSTGRRFLYYARSYDEAWTCGERDSVLMKGESVTGAVQLERHEAARVSSEL